MTQRDKTYWNDFHDHLLEKKGARDKDIKGKTGRSTIWNVTEHLKVTVNDVPKKRKQRCSFSTASGPEMYCHLGVPRKTSSAGVPTVALHIDGQDKQAGGVLTQREFEKLYRARHLLRLHLNSREISYDQDIQSKPDLKQPYIKVAYPGDGPQPRSEKDEFEWYYEVLSAMRLFWAEVFGDSGLSINECIELAKNASGRGGEGPLHKALKEYIAAHPEVLGLPKTMAPGTTEHPLPSGDSIDVFFESKTRWIAVEIKSRISRRDDQIRGLYQCVKYGAVLEAVAKTEDPTVSVETILVLESEPLFLLALEHALGIDVRSGITPPA